MIAMNPVPVHLNLRLRSDFAIEIGGLHALQLAIKSTAIAYSPVSEYVPPYVNSAEVEDMCNCVTLPPYVAYFETCSDASSGAEHIAIAIAHRHNDVHPLYLEVPMGQLWDDLKAKVLGETARDVLRVSDENGLIEGKRYSNTGLLHDRVNGRLWLASRIACKAFLSARLHWERMKEPSP